MKFHLYFTLTVIMYIFKNKKKSTISFDKNTLLIILIPTPCTCYL